MSHSPLLQELLRAADRDRCPQARQLVCYREDDEPGFLAALDQRALVRVDLERRGGWHGRVAALEALPPDLEEDRRRWSAARPVLRPGLVAVLPRERERELAESAHLATSLRAPTGLLDWLHQRADRLPKGFRIGDSLPRADPDRDIARRCMLAPDDSELWLKTARLSTHSEDRSIRLRASWGAEGRDDSSRDPRRDAHVRTLSEALLPGASKLSAAVEVAEELSAERLEPTQHIAYWNAPGGGALFHHDAFDEPHATRQRAVLYAQLSGSTVWLALSTADLLRRLRELTEALEESTIPWVERALEEVGLGPPGRAALLEQPDDALADELALPGCGRLAPLVNLGPEFSCLLADAGHAFLLEAGDLILLPNHGPARTAYHSVFCASPQTAYGLSLALRHREH